MKSPMPDVPGAEVARRPRHVWVYGGDHSPWVQSVLLGLHERGIAHTVVTVPPLCLFLNSGILMPAARIDDGPWLLDSQRILAELGFGEVAVAERRALQVVSGSGAFQRTDSPWDFWYCWSYLRDGHPALGRRLWNHLWRPFSVFYFFTLITIARRTQPEQTSERLSEEFSFWEERLGAGWGFLGGEAPNTADLQLFGLFQMYGSIPGPSLAVLQQDPKLERLRQWIETMQRRFSSYGHLYTGSHFEPPLAEIERSPVYERAFYWLGCALLWLAFPITLLTTMYFARRVRKTGLQRA
jgi:glutathione S-transferase